MFLVLRSTTHQNGNNIMNQKKVRLAFFFLNNEIGRVWRTILEIWSYINFCAFLFLVVFASFVADFFVTTLLARNPVDYPRVLPSLLGKDNTLQKNWL